MKTTGSAISFSSASTAWPPRSCARTGWCSTPPSGRSTNATSPSTLTAATELSSSPLNLPPNVRAATAFSPTRTNRCAISSTTALKARPSKSSAPPDCTLMSTPEPAYGPTPLADRDATLKRRRPRTASSAPLNTRVPRASRWPTPSSRTRPTASASTCA